MTRFVALLASLVAGCAATHAPGIDGGDGSSAVNDVGYACGRWCGPCCPGDVCNDGSFCSSGWCELGVPCPDAGPRPDLGGPDAGPPTTDAAPPIDYGFSCGHWCEPCCEGNTCLSGVDICSFGFCQRGAACDAWRPDF